MHCIKTGNSLAKTVFLGNRLTYKEVRRWYEKRTV